MSIRILQGDARTMLATLPDASVHCVVTSPPYYGLRAYLPDGHADKRHEIGMEPTPDAYIATMVAVFREVRRVLQPDGTCWVNMGDSFSSGNSGQRMRDSNGGMDKGPGTRTQSATLANPGRAPTDGLATKQLLMMPARLALTLQADGWWLRSDIIWHKPNPMPESVTDRPTSSHEHVFLLTKSARYFYDAEAVREPSITNDPRRPYTSEGAKQLDGRDTWRSGERREGDDFTSRNLRNVWTIVTQPYKGAHFATFPKELASRCIKAGTSERGCCTACGAPWVRVVERGAPDLAHQRASGGDACGEYHGQSTKGHAAHGVQDASDVKARILAGMVEKTTTGWSPSCACPPSDPIPCTVLDPFAGSGTVGAVAASLGRQSCLIELNPAYIKLIEARMQEAVGGKYTGPLIAGRFQVIESMIGNTFFVADNQQEPDLVVREGGKILHFESQMEAENWIHNNHGEEQMLTPETIQPRARGNVGPRTKELIQQGLDNDAIIAKLKMEFPNNANSLANVRSYRYALKKEQGEPVGTRAPRITKVSTMPRPTNGADVEENTQTLEQIGRTLQALGSTLVKMEKENRQLKAKNESLLKNMRAMLEG